MVEAVQCPGVGPGQGGSVQGQVSLHLLVGFWCLCGVSLVLTWSSLKLTPRSPPPARAAPTWAKETVMTHLQVQVQVQVQVPPRIKIPSTESAKGEAVGGNNL